MTDPEAEVDTVTIPRRQLRSLYRAVLVLVLLGFATAAPLAYFALQQGTVNDRFDAQAEQMAAQAEANARDLCRAVNEARRDGREFARRGDLDAGEVLVTVVSGGGPVTPQLQAMVDRYRELLSAQEAENVEQHAADDRDCAAEARARARHPE